MAGGEETTVGPVFAIGPRRGLERAAPGWPIEARIEPFAPRRRGSRRGVDEDLAHRPRLGIDRRQTQRRHRATVEGDRDEVVVEDVLRMPVHPPEVAPLLATPAPHHAL